MKYSRLVVLLASVSAAGLLGSVPASSQGSAAPSSSTVMRSEATPPSQPWAHEASDVVVDPSIRFGTLSNGLRYAIKSNKTPPNHASVWLRIDAGSLMERDDQLGLAHFMEHMAFNGTKEIPKNELIHQLERLGLQFGADLNAATSYDQTFYQLNIPSIDDNKLNTGLHILRQQVSAATMDPKEIDDERGVIKGEERLRNSPTVATGQKQLAVLAAGTRIPSRFPIGDMSIIATAPRQRFVDFYQTYYRPSRATVIAVGDFDVDQMEAKIKNVFADWQPSAPDAPDPDVGQAAPQKQTARVYVDPNLQSSVSINWTDKADLRPDTLATRRESWVRGLALAVLRRRLDEQSREDNPPFVAATASEADVFRALHLASIQATYLPGKWKPALDAIEKSYRQLAEFGVSDAELQREINTNRTALETAVRSEPTQQTVRLAAAIEASVNERSVLTSAQTDLDIFESVVKTVTAQEVSEAAKKIFVGEGPLIFLTSTQTVEGGDLALNTAYEASKADPVSPAVRVAKMDWPYTQFGTPGQVVDISGPDKLGARTATFANGVKLTVKQTDFEKDAISIGLLTGIGDANFSPAQYSPLRAAVGNLFPGGLNKMSVDDIARSLNGHRVGGGLSTLGQKFLISGETGREDLKLEMQYLAAFMTDAAYRSNAFDKVIAGAPAAWMLAESSPGGVYGLKVRALMAGGDKRVEYTPPEITATWSMDTLRDDARKLLSYGPIHIVMSGDLSLEDAIGATAPTFGALPSRPAANAPAAGADRRLFAKPTAKPLVFTHNGLADQAMGTVSWPAVDATGPRRLPRQLAILKAVLQLRVLDVIREKEALAYSPGVASEYSADYKGYGYFEIQAATAPEKLPAFYAAVDRITRELREKPISMDELNRARQPVIEQERRAMEGNGWWFREMLGAVYRPSTLDDAMTVIADYESVTPAMIQQFARTYLVPAKAFKASVVPASPGDSTSTVASAK